MSCYDCDQYSQCTKGEGCLDHKPPFKFCHKDNSPQKEVLSDLFYFTGFLLALAIVCLVAGIGWGWLVRTFS